MSVPTISFSPDKLVKLGLKIADNLHYQLSPEELVEDTLKRGQGVLKRYRCTGN
jgi:phosphoenolpyruvate carboxykinase (ATP)